ncbi:hypothetical protein [uncultured Chitinophaga sp.]|uniref:hypothetical protein n=1 Tax=uncultured Chitinophaga sp. TaxID=339340 RepID=UPI0025DA6BBD|nr:hypothetical protein [uncultured Chitinophaga sp.]
MAKLKNHRRRTKQDIDNFIAVRLTDEQQKEAAEQLREVRRISQANMTDRDRLISRLLQFRFRIADYIENNHRDKFYSFSYFLKEYISILNIADADFAGHIGISSTLLSRLINQKQHPPKYVMVRLEIHSNKTIPADYWCRLVHKQQLRDLELNEEIRKVQRPFVPKTLDVSFSA